MQTLNWESTNNYIPSYVASISADVEDAIEDGVVIIAAAGNDNYYVAEQADPEWNSSSKHIRSRYSLLHARF